MAQEGMSNGRPPWTERHTEILRMTAAMRYTNAEIQAAILAETGAHFSTFTISRHRAAGSLPKPRPVGNNRARRIWRRIEAAGTIAA